MKTEIRIRRVDNGYIVSESTNIVDEWKDVAIACGPHDLCDVIRSIFSQTETHTSEVISEEDQTKLFKKFSRLSAKPTGGESSTGLGLSIVKRLAESMNGTVGCRSRLGDGAEFYVKLPAGK